ncbi:FRG domain-containing protein [Microbacterium sp. Sa4CUA7]|uniref:FRG domain-containing protein n=1 Tax=Microbacterium pullorum TaxID=2762236 RepID=A0ABR8RZX8_9MICO|nr:FRG domain-containing protein [Microbacterium pullorum]MBD7956399.1 FRG domain-containing protein [Microbacterium pullorum]
MHTDAMQTDATELFAPWERRIDSWADLQTAINELTGLYRTESFVWRGQSDASWGLHSSLSRAIHGATGRYPTEAELVEAEKRLLDRARIDWRLDGIPALQLFAQMQHVGVPTRLLDVTYNPLIAAWFAVSRDEKTNESDGRLLVFGSTKAPVQLNSQWNANRPRWHRLDSDAARHQVNWGTGLGRKIWRPPAVHGRIPAQNAAFIIDGVPIDLQDGHSVARGARSWTASELREVTSIPMRFAHAREGQLPAANAPVFTYRIGHAAKSEIRDQLERRFGYSFSTVYADIEGLAEYVRRWPRHALLGR